MRRECLLVYAHVQIDTRCWSRRVMTRASDSEVVPSSSPIPSLQARSGVIELSSDGIEALVNDVPARLRASLSGSTNPRPEKHGLSVSDDDTNKKYARFETTLPDTSDIFALGWSDGWDLDDAQLFSDESLLLTSDAPPSSPIPTPDSLRAPQTPGEILLRFLDSLLAEEDECGPDATEFVMVGRSEGEIVILPRAAQQLYGLLSHCARETDKAILHGGKTTSSKPVHLLDVDTTKLQRLIALLDTTIRRTSILSLSAPLDEYTVRCCNAALICVRSCLLIFAYDQLPKFLFSEETLLLCVDTLKETLNQFILPLADACTMSPKKGLALKLEKNEISDSLQALLDIHFRQVCAATSMLEPLFCLSSLAMSETFTIRSVYLCIAPYISSDLAIGPKRAVHSHYLQVHALRPLRLASLATLRSIMARCSDQRVWIITQILSSSHLFPDMRQRKRWFRLSNGRSVYMMTAILLQLLQAASYCAPALLEQSYAWFDEAEIRADKEKPPSQEQQEFLHALASSLSGALVKNCNKSNELSIDDQPMTTVAAVVEDVLILLFLPDWPAASILLSTLTKTFIVALRETKGPKEIKNVALDQLGLIATSIRQAELAMQTKRAKRCGELQYMSDICRTCNVNALYDLDEAYRSIIYSMQHARKNDPATEAAARFVQAQYLYELALALRSLSCDDNATQEFLATLTTLSRRTEEAPSRLRKDSHILPQLVLHSTFFIPYSKVLHVILSQVNSQALSLRTRSMRALGSISHVDPSFLSNGDVRRVISEHMVDSGAAIRESCVAILGAFLLSCPKYIPTYYELFKSRMLDTAVSVRKRTVKFMHDVYYASDVNEVKTGAVLSLLQRMQDIDPTVQTMAFESLIQLWLGPTSKENVSTIMHQLLTACRVFHWRPSPLDEFLRRLGDERKDSEEIAKLAQVVDEMLLCCVTDEETLTSFRSWSYVVQAIASAHPNVVSITRAKQLLPYIENPESISDVERMEALLRIFIVCLPHMPRTALSFAKSLEDILAHMITHCRIHPSTSPFEAIVQCFCLTIAYQTHHKDRLDQMFDKCMRRFRRITSADTISASQKIVVYILAMLAGFTPSSVFDPGVTTLKILFSRLLQLYSTAACEGQQLMLAALGYLLRAHPTFFLDHAMIPIVHKELQGGNRKELLLQPLLDYLSNDEYGPQFGSESIREQLQGQAINDAGLASVLLQQFAEDILGVTLLFRYRTVQHMAMAILRIAIRQGLMHPVQCIPYLIALETSDDEMLCLQAAHLHRYLFARHASLLATRVKECVRMAGRIHDTSGRYPRGARVKDAFPEARFQTWFDIVSERRSSRLGFLRSLVHTMDVDMDRPCTEEDVACSLFVADNLATMEYRVAEEPLLVLYELAHLEASTAQSFTSLAQRRLRTAAHQRELSPLTDEEDEVAHSDASSEEDQALATGTDDAESMCPLKRSSIGSLALAAARIDIIRVLRKHIKHLYKLSESKCAKFEPDRRAPMGDRPIARMAVSDAAKALTPWTSDDIPRAHEEEQALEYLESFVAQEDDVVASESDSEYD